MINSINFEDFLLSTKVGRLVVDETVPFVEQKNCPACDGILSPVAELESRRTAQKIRYGICPACGYMGYIDRPGRTWLADYYARAWDKLIPRTSEGIRSQTILAGKSGPKASRFIAFNLARQLGLDKSQAVLEIGSGYGEVLKNFKDDGFKTVVGIENSDHRANLVSETFGMPVLAGGFEQQAVQAKLGEYRPFGLIFSHHVLEHTFNPDEIIDKISMLQDYGGYLVLALPNARGEHINYALFYLVHLHSFTKEGLEIILNRHGYQVVKDSSPDPTNIIVAAQKTADPKPIFPRQTDYLNQTRGRLSKTLGLAVIRPGTLYELNWWQELTASDPARIKPLGGGMPAWQWKKTIAFLKRKLGRYDTVYTFLLSAAGNDESASKAVKIFFKDKIGFMAK